MKIVSEPLPGLFLLEPSVFGDERGYFFESWNHGKFCELIQKEVHFVQDNQSLSGKGVVRGLHLQAPPFAQGKLVRVVRGTVLDIALDIRKNSPTYGKHFSAELSEKNHRMMWIPEGFAHGFSVLEDQTIFLYKCTNFYNKASEHCIRYNDSALNINWKTEQAIVSEKDKEGLLLSDFESPFTYV
ncbi:MAG TPA: dTDP-4-dehydrorhamnose 3,5-epimerase [Flavobacteriales bacterium]|nr:dTDP-4-dehydrorhamnose 3,5-epimerase [Flavobacteriales bacterium]HRE74754.1 dTDP-4-dehydrorhamnose 3,5-epimerase [Flavobacteriales bacterium]HRJ35592.1 dTDP-4-dehydrorhamnose 3,5-epimerase [Flavobacteriales bacterium]